MEQINTIIPARWVMPLWPVKVEQIVFVNWLDVEVPVKEPIPVVEHLSHWRNRDVFRYIQAYDWTAKMFDAPIKIENVHFDRHEMFLTKLRKVLTTEKEAKGGS